MTNDIILMHQFLIVVIAIAAAILGGGVLLAKCLGIELDPEKPDIDTRKKGKQNQKKAM